MTLKMNRKITKAQQQIILSELFYFFLSDCFSFFVSNKHLSFLGQIRLIAESLCFLATQNDQSLHFDFYFIFLNMKLYKMTARRFLGIRIKKSILNILASLIFFLGSYFLFLYQQQVTKRIDQISPASHTSNSFYICNRCSFPFQLSPSRLPNFPHHRFSKLLTSITAMLTARMPSKSRPFLNHL